LQWKISKMAGIISLILTICCFLFVQFPALGNETPNRSVILRPLSNSCVEQIDATQCPDERALSAKIIRACDENYERVVSLFGLPPRSNTEKIRIVLITDKSGPYGSTRGNELVLNADWLRLHPDDLGIVVYQLACGFERFPNPQPGCSQPPPLCAALADYARANAVGASASNWCAQCNPGDSILNSSKYGAAFLMYMERTYPQARPVATVYGALSTGLYTDDVWRQMTGKPMLALLSDFAAGQSQPLVYRPQPSSCVNFIDYTGFPALAQLCPQVVHALDANYARARSLLGTPPGWHGEKLEIAFRHTVPGHNSLGSQFVGVTLGHQIIFNGDLAEKDPHDACGALVHEMSHVLQQYPRTRPGYTPGPEWLTEGMADYVRACARDFEDRHTWCALCAQNQTYKVGYSCAASFLIFLERNYPASRPVENVNLALINGSYSDSLWGAMTGKTLDSLWQDFAPSKSMRPQISMNCLPQQPSVNPMPPQASIANLQGHR
jgi:Peptidase of plants and bacteria